MLNRRIPALVLALLLLSGCVGVPSVNAPEVLDSPAETAAPEAGGTLPIEELPKESPAVETAAPPEPVIEISEQSVELPSAPAEVSPEPSALSENFEPQQSEETLEVEEVEYQCTLSVSCAAVLDQMDALDGEKWEMVPEDGWILPPTEVVFYEGESVFHVLQRTLKTEKIHLEFANAPLYKTAYIEGIGNLYELDAGALSGWMYAVNEWYPNYGCSRYILQDGDEIVWRFTCNLGDDIGGRNELEPVE